MKTNKSLSGNVGIQTVALILAVVAIILGIAGIQAGHSSKKTVEDLQMKVDSQAAGTEQLANDIRQLKAQSQSAFSALSQEIVNLRDQMTKKPEPPKDESKKGEKKDAKDAKDEAAAPGTVHKVVAGDSLGRIAKQSGTTVANLEKLNPGVNSKNLKVGQKIRVK